MSSPREDLARRIAGEVTLSDDPGATLRKWRTDFDVSQTALARQLDVSSSVISDYESGRRESPGIGVVRRTVDALLDIDEARGGDRIRQYARVLSAGFESDIVLDLREYPTSIPLERLYDAMDATELVRGDEDRISGHTAIDSIQAITRLSSEEFYRLYGQSTSRAPEGRRTARVGRPAGGPVLAARGGVSPAALAENPVVVPVVVPVDRPGRASTVAAASRAVERAADEGAARAARAVAAGPAEISRVCRGVRRAAARAVARGRPSPTTVRSSWK